MSNSGFRLLALRVVGPDVSTAAVEFNRGLNVIAGPSDTGKTFVLKCINFALGAKDPPKGIPESERYDRVLLSLEHYETGDVFTIERSLRGGNLLLHEGVPDPHAPDLSAQTLKAQHSAKSDDSVSHFLLGLCSLSGKRLRKNSRGETKDLSFRDLARLTLVDEETVISERSPIHSGRSQNKTAESSLFRLLLTGVDDSSLVATEDPKMAKVRRAGRVEILEDIADQVRSDLADLLGEEVEREAVESRLDELNAEAEEITYQLQAERQEIGGVETKRREAWKALRRVESRIAVLSELGVRFELLDEHYRSDVSRLESISEAASRLAELQEERCPLCGAPAEHQHPETEQADLSPAQVRRACSAENEKIVALRDDLASTVSHTEVEIRDLQTEFEARSSELAVLDDHLRGELKPKVSDWLVHLGDLNEQRAPLTSAIGLFDRLEHLESLAKSATEVGPAVEPLPPAGVGVDETSGFCKRVEELLKAWSYPGVGRVTFSEKDEDIVISGRRRASHGKGVRAVTHAAFVLGLLRFAERESRPHPGFVLIDSPLVVYRAPDAGESLPANVKEGFYRATAKMFRRRQVIVIENEDPPEDLARATVIRFTKSDSGRRGLIPV